MAVTSALLSSFPKETAPGGRCMLEAVVSAAPGLLKGPTDIVLTVDRTFPMIPELLQEEKKGAAAFVDEIAAAAGTTSEGRILNDVRIGICAYDHVTMVNTVITDDSVLLKNAIKNMGEACGGIDHQAAIRKSAEMLKASKGKKVMVIYSQAAATKGGDGSKEAEDAKKAGIEIFAMGPLYREENLKKWASIPLNTHLFLKAENETIDTVYKKASDVIKAKDTGPLSLEIELSQDFNLSAIEKTSIGRAHLASPGRILWEIGHLGGENFEEARLSASLYHSGSTLGQKNVTAKSTLSDTAGPIRELASPQILIKERKAAVIPAEKDKSIDFTVPPCADGVSLTAQKDGLDSLGRIVSIDLRIRSVCPGRRANVSVQLFERDAFGKETLRGAKHLVIPPQEGTECMDVIIKDLRFSLPEEQEENGGSLCEKRELSVRVIANYADTIYVPLNGEASL